MANEEAALEERDEAEDEGGVQGDPGPLECEVCGREFESKFQLGTHRWNSHKLRTVKAPPSGRGPGRPKGSSSRPRRAAATDDSESARQARRRKAVRETLLELTTFTDELRGRGEGEVADLADVIRRDADKLASSVAWIEERFTPLGRVIDLAFGHGGVITVGRGFMGVGSWVLGRWRTLLTERAAAEGGQEFTAEELAERMEAQYREAQERAYVQ